VIFFDELKRIFETKFRDLFSNNTITIFKFTKNEKQVIEIKENTLSLDLSKSNDQEKKSIKGLLDFIVQGKEEIFLNSLSSEKTQSIKNNLPDQSDKSLLDFYKDKLNPDMYKALEMSLVVRSFFKKGGNITELKRDISKKYPSFGNNLCNLTTEGYFDTHFKDLYDNMIQDEDEAFDIRVYQKKVENIVNSLPFTVFVTRYKTYDELSGEVLFKLEKLKKYGTGKLLLHGIGKENVNTTLTILEEYKEKKDLAIQKDVNPGKTIITVTLLF